MSTSSIAVRHAKSMIRSVRGQQVILDADLASVYGVQTRVLNQAVRRNRRKFPKDFMFRLTPQEAGELNPSRSQTVTLKRGGNIKYLPFAFTEHGALMAANVLRSPRAVEMSVFVVRAFVRMRRMITNNKDLAMKLVQLEKYLKRRLDLHETAIVDVLQRIMNLIDPPPGPEPEKKRIGY